MNATVSGQQWSDIGWVTLYSGVATLFFLCVFWLRRYAFSNFLRRAVYWARIYRDEESGSIDRECASTAPDDVDNEVSKHAVDFFWSLLLEPNSTKETSLSERLDLESYLFLRLLRLCFSICLLGSFAIAPVLCFAYSTLGAESSSSRISFERLTASSVEKGSKVLWLSLCAMSLLVAYTISAVFSECRVYERARKRWAIRPYRRFGSPRTPSSSTLWGRPVVEDGVSRLQREHSAFIERIPDKTATSDRTLYAYLDRMFPDQVHSVVVCREIPANLRRLFAEREKVVSEIEKKMVVIEADVLSTSFKIDMSSENARLDALNKEIAEARRGIEGGDEVAIDDNIMSNVSSYGSLRDEEDEDDLLEEGDFFVTQSLERMTKSVAKAFQNLTVGSRASQSAFVTFTSLQTALVCRSLKRFTASYRRAFDVANLVPDRDDVYWENIDQSADSVEQRSTLFTVLIFFVTLEWYLVLLACYALATHMDSNNTLVESFVAYIPILSVNGLLALLPYLLLFLSVKYEKMKFDSRANSLVLRRYFMFQLVNIYVTIFTGSVLSEITSLLKKPASALGVLADELPVTAGYFVEIVVCKILLVLPFELARLLPVIRASVALFAGRLRSTSFAPNDLAVAEWARSSYQATLTKRELRSSPFEPLGFRFSFQYPSILMVILIAFVFCATAPIVFPFCLAYFLFAIWVYSWQMHHVYVSPHGSAGVYFFPALERLLGGLTAASIVFSAYLFLKEAYTPLVISLLLPCATGYTQYSINATYGSLATASMSLEYANKTDKAAAGVPIDFDPECYRQPELRARKVKPETQRSQTM